MSCTHVLGIVKPFLEFSFYFWKQLAWAMMHNPVTCVRQSHVTQLLKSLTKFTETVMVSSTVYKSWKSFIASHGRLWSRHLIISPVVITSPHHFTSCDQSAMMDVCGTFSLQHLHCSCNVGGQDEALSPGLCRLPRAFHSLRISKSCFQNFLRWVFLVAFPASLL